MPLRPPLAVRWLTVPLLFLVATVCLCLVPMVSRPYLVAALLALLAVTATAPKPVNAEDVSGASLLSAALLPPGAAISQRLRRTIPTRSMQ